MTSIMYYAMLRTLATICRYLNFTWREYTMRDGRRGWVLFLDESVWTVDKDGEILPKEEA